MKKTVSSRVKHFGRYSRIPTTVLFDRSLSPQAVLAYGVLAASVFQGNIATIGMRLIGKLLGESPATVMRRMQELIAAGHIKAAPKKRGHRACYELTSPVFGQKQRAGAEEVISSPSGGRRLASVRRSA